MTPSQWMLCGLWSLGAVYFGTLAAAIPEASLGRLEEEFKRRGRDAGFKHFQRRSAHYATTAWSGWLLVALMMMLTVDRLVPNPPEALPWKHPARVFFYAVLWLLSAGMALPRALASHAGESIIAATYPVLELFRRAALPALALADWTSEIVRRLAGRPPADAETSTEKIEQEILDIVSAAHTTGAVGPTESRVIRSAIDLEQRTAGEIMTPRTEMIGLEASATYQEAREAIAAAGHSRIPVYEDAIDNILGVLYAKDLLRVGDSPAFSIRQQLRSVPFVPETKPLSDLMREFQTSRVHLAIVLDEYGGTAGLVTLEDILEELVGEIADEHEQPTPSSIRRLDNRTVELDARMRVDEVNAALSLRIPEDDAYDTVAGFLLSRFGRIPARGESFALDDLSFLVIDADERRINRLRLQLSAPAEA